MCIPPTCGRLGGRRARAPLWVVRSDCAGLQGSRGGCSGLTADTHARQNGHTRGRENGGRGRSRTRTPGKGHGALSEQEAFIVAVHTNASKAACSCSYQAACTRTKSLTSHHSHRQAASRGARET